MAKIIGNTTTTPIAIPEVTQVTTVGDGVNSLVLNNTENNAAIASYSLSGGKAAIAGMKAYYISAFDFDNKQLYLSKEQVTLPTIGAGVKDESFETPPYNIGVYIGIGESGQYLYTAKIEAVENNVVTYSGDLGFDASLVIERTDPDEHTFYVPEQPDIGAITFGSNNFAFGDGANALGTGAVAIGPNVIANKCSAAFGFLNKANAYSFVAGQNNIAGGMFSTAFGQGNMTYARGSFATGVNNIAKGQCAFVEGESNQAIGARAHATGYSTMAYGNNSNTSGNNTKAYGNSCHAEGQNTIAGDIDDASKYASHAEGVATKATHTGSHAEGWSTEAIGSNSHAEGWKSKAEGEGSHAEGQETTATAKYSHTEGIKTTTAAPYTHAEGYETTASGNNAHSEGRSTIAKGENAHAEGFLSEANGTCAHAEGYKTKSNGYGSHASGGYTIARENYQMVVGRSNKDDANAYFIVGNGEEYGNNRSNAFVVKKDGSAEIQTQGTTDNSVVQKKYVDDAIAGIEINGGDTDYSAEIAELQTNVEDAKNIATTADTRSKYNEQAITELQGTVSNLGGGGIKVITGTYVGDGNDSYVITISQDKAVELKQFTVIGGVMGIYMEGMSSILDVEGNAFPIHYEATAWDGGGYTVLDIGAHKPEASNSPYNIDGKTYYWTAIIKE